MKKTLIAAAVLSAVSAQAVAIEVYNDDTSSLSIGGRLGIKTQFIDGDSQMDNASSRINFSFEHKLNEEVTAYTKAEWGFDPVTTGGDENFSNRLGYIGLRHARLGSLQFGKQWSVYSDIASWTDQFYISGGAAMGMYNGVSSDGGVNGTGRADDAIAYRFNQGGLQAGAQYQLGNSGDGTDNFENSFGLHQDNQWERKHGQQFAASYEFDFGLSLGASYNQTSFKGRDDAKAQVVGAKYINERVHLAATYGKFENHTNAMDDAGFKDSNIASMTGYFDKESTGVELFALYNLESVDGLGVYLGYNNLEVDERGGVPSAVSDSKGKLEKTALGTVYTIGPMDFSAEYIKDDSTNHDGTDDRDNVVAVQARYHF